MKFLEKFFDLLCLQASLSVPPPNQLLLVLINLVLKWAAGINGECICATTEMPVA